MGKWCAIRLKIKIYYKKNITYSLSSILIKNYFIIAIRNLWRNPFYSSINIFGLAAGIACFLLIMMYIQDERSYDKFNTKSERIFRLIEIIESSKQGEQSSSCPFPTGPTLKRDYPQFVDKVVRFFNEQTPQHTLSVGGRKMNESGLFFVDSTIFQVFDYELLMGDKNKALTQPYSIVLTEKLAKKYFGNQNPMGKSIKYDGVREMKVTGILKEIPAQSHIHFDCLISFSSLKLGNKPDTIQKWVWNPCWTYILLKEGVKPQSLSEVFPNFIQKYYPQFLKTQVSHLLQPLTDIHLHSNYSYEIESNNDERNLWIFFLIGIFILAIACMNFTNLTTARYANRAKEIGIRKVAGAQNNQLIPQFLAESVLLSFISLVIAFAFAELLLPLFNNLSEKQIHVSYMFRPDILLITIVVAIVTGLLSGAYPAFYLSSFEPISVLRGKLSSASRNAYLRKSLVVIQFAISLSLIIATTIVHKQLAYLRSAKLGFDKSQVVMIPVRRSMEKAFVPFLDSMRNSQMLENVTVANDIIGKHHNIHEFNLEGMQPGTWIYYPALIVDEHFIPTLNIELLAGRNFSPEIPSDDTLGAIVNESFVKNMKWGNPQSALGKQLFSASGKERVIGVVKDFHFESLLNPAGPFVLDIPRKENKSFWTQYIMIKIPRKSCHEILKFIKSSWEHYAKEFPFEYFFLEDELHTQYKSQDNLAQLITYFSILAIIIACLGLFALSAYTATLRTKEIGIRKVMGASTRSIVILLGKDFVRLVLLGNLIAYPLTWFLMEHWLQRFAYRIEISGQFFIGPTLLTLILSILTVSFHTIRVGKLNPMQSLRHE